MVYEYDAQIFRSPKFKSIVSDAIKFLINTPVHDLPPQSRFKGSGVYVLYYLGEHSLYTPISTLNKKECTKPIYIGKAVPRGWRMGRTNKAETSALYSRLLQHAHSIEKTTDLDIKDFRCRFMVLNDIEGDLVVPVEAELIRKYQPLWNHVLDGFGNHDPGAGRYQQARSDWDILHPGRGWVSRLSGKSATPQEIMARIQKFLS